MQMPSENKNPSKNKNSKHDKQNLSTAMGKKKHGCKMIATHINIFDFYFQNEYVPFNMTK